MAEIKYLFIQGGNRIELRNGNEELPFGSVSEISDALAVFRITASHEGIKIDTVKSRKDIIFNPAGSIL